MKAMFINGELRNFVSDSYKCFPDPKVKIVEIKGLDESINADEIAKNKTTDVETGYPFYVIDSEGIVRKNTAPLNETQIEFSKKNSDILAEIDKLVIEYYRKALLGYPQTELVPIKEKIEAETSKIEDKYKGKDK